MSFASEVRMELARAVCEDECCARSEIAAALLCASGISYRGRDRYNVSLTSPEAAVVRHYFATLRHFFDITGEMQTLKTEQLGMLTHYRLVVPQEDSLRLIKACGLYDPTKLFGIGTPSSDEILHFACCRKTFVRSAFLMCGTVTNPTLEYHLELALPNDELAEILLEILEYFSISAKSSVRKEKTLVYIKRSEDIADMLRLMGASQSTMALEDIRIRKELTNQVNRQMNCDISNTDRMAEAASAQIRDIRYIDEELGLDKLPRTLQEMAAVRVNNPGTPLSGLGEMMVPPIGKSGVNARLRRISQIAEKLRTGEEIELK